MGILSLISKKALPVSSTKLRTIPLRTVLGRDPYAPNYELNIQGGKGAKPVQLTEAVTRNIEEIIFEDNADQFDHLTIEFVNQMDEKGGDAEVLSLIDNKLLTEGSVIEVKMGYGDSLLPVGAAEIVKKSPSYGSSGVSFMLDGYDLLHRMFRSNPRGGYSYLDLRYSQIASIIGERNGFVITADDPSTFKGIRKTESIYRAGGQNKGINDYRFLKKLADTIGFDLFSKFDAATNRFILFFQPPSVAKQKEVFTFVYNEGDVSYPNSIIEFDLTLDAGDQATDFEIYVVRDRDIGGTNSAFIEWLGIAEQNQIREMRERRFTGNNPGSEDGKQISEDDGTRYAFKAFGRSFLFPPHKRFKSEDEARNSIIQFITRQKENFITGSGRLLGNEALQSRQIHNLQGLGEQFSGKYYFTNVRHIMSRKDGYHCEFSCRKVIQDFLVQAPPAFTISENDKRFEKLKGER
jgi:phage protein D